MNTTLTSAGEFDYDASQVRYAHHRAADPSIESQIHRCIPAKATVANIGAGAGSYEPTDRFVLAFEPSASMRAERLASGRVPAIDATAEKLPIDNESVDVAMAVLTIHHWTDLKAGLFEMARIAKHRVLILTYDPAELACFWNVEYFPEVVAVEKRRYPAIQTIADAFLGWQCTVHNIQIPLDCTDGFQEAFYGRPEAFLDEEVRRAQSAWGFVPNDVAQQGVRRLSDEIQSGAWDQKYRAHRSMPFFEGAFRAVVFDR